MLLLTSFPRLQIQQLSALFYSLLLLCLLCNREERVLIFEDTFVLLYGVNQMYFKYCKIAYWVCLDCCSLAGNTITQKVVKEVNVFTVISIRKPLSCGDH